MPSELPLEIEESILDLLAEDDKGHSALKTCSLVCHAFLPICRKHIFGSIVLTYHQLASPPFGRLLRETPEIADYIRKLELELNYNIRFADSTALSIQESLKQISRLEFLTIPHKNGWTFDWSNNPIRPALLHLLHLPTLTHFKMSEINNFVISDLIPCVNLKYLDIGSYTTLAAENAFPAAFPEHPIQLNEFVARSDTSAAIEKLCTARRPDGQPIIDFGFLSKITVYIDRREAQELLRRCRVLTSVDTCFHNSRSSMPSLADMLRPSMQTLKHLAVRVLINHDSIDLLFGITSELEDMRTKNIIETVTIEIWDSWHASYSRRNDWGHSRLDEVLTTPGWFSLKQVSLSITIVTHGERYDSDGVALRRLSETQFPRLSSSNSVSFAFEVMPISLPH